MKDYLVSAEKQFRQYKSLGERALAQISAEDVHWQYNEESNSLAVIVKHLSGNMLSRWTDFLHSDGEKRWRNRESEFSAEKISYEQLMETWEEGWDCVFSALAGLTPEDLEKPCSFGTSRTPW